MTDSEEDEPDGQVQRWVLLHLSFQFQFSLSVTELNKYPHIFPVCVCVSAHAW